MKLQCKRSDDSMMLLPSPGRLTTPRGARRWWDLSDRGGAREASQASAPPRNGKLV